RLEPPCTDPYARWCGRGRRVTAAPMPITAFPRDCLEESWQSLTLQKVRYKLFLLPGELTRPENRPALRLRESPSYRSGQEHSAQGSPTEADPGLKSQSSRRIQVSHPWTAQTEGRRWDRDREHPRGATPSAVRDPGTPYFCK